MTAHKRIAKEVGGPTSKTSAWQTGNRRLPCFRSLSATSLAFTHEIVKLRRPTAVTFDAIAAKLTSPRRRAERVCSSWCLYIRTVEFLETFWQSDMARPVTEAV